MASIPSKIKVKKEKKTSLTDAPWNDTELLTAEDTEVSAQADNESRLEFMIENHKKAHVYKVGTKEELFGVKPTKSGTATISTSKLTGSKRSHILDASKVPTNTVTRKRKRQAVQETPPPEPPLVEPSQEIDWSKVACACVLIAGGLYLIHKGRAVPVSAETISELAESSVEI